MENEIVQKLKTIDDEISNALTTITELEEKLTTARVDDEGNILKDECVILKNKFSSFNKSMGDLTKMLAELGIIDSEDAF